MWQHTELREVYRKAGWKESHFIIAPTPGSTTNSSTMSRSGTNVQSGTLRTNGQMTPSASLMMTPSTPTNANGTLPGTASSLYHSISANNTLSRPMSTVGGTKYEDHHQYASRSVASGGGGGGTLPRPGHQQQQMMQNRVVRNSCVFEIPFFMLSLLFQISNDMLLAEMNHQKQQQQMIAMQAALDNQMMNGGGTLGRPPIGGVPIFPPGAVSILDSTNISMT